MRGKGQLGRLIEKRDFDDCLRAELRSSKYTEGCKRRRNLPNQTQNLRNRRSAKSS